MEKYKICPSCGTKNEPTLLECVNCETDLTRIKITDEENEKNAPPIQTPAPTVRMVRMAVMV